MARKKKSHDTETVEDNVDPVSDVVESVESNTEYPEQEESPAPETTEDDAVSAVDEIPLPLAEEAAEPEIILPPPLPVLALRAGAADFVRRKLRSRLPLRDCPDESGIADLLVAAVAGKSVVIVRNQLVIGDFTGRPTLDVVAELKRHGFLKTV